MVDWLILNKLCTLNVSCECSQNGKIIEVCPESLEAIFAEIERVRPRVCTKGCVSLRKSKIGSLNPRESENGFCVSLLNRSIQDLSDHGTSKEPKNPVIAKKWLYLTCLVYRLGNKGSGKQ